MNASDLTAKIVGIGKDLLALLRDLALFVFALLLLCFPNKFNTVLTDAGFEEGSLVGFKWKKTLNQSNDANIKAKRTIDSLRVRLNATSDTLLAITQKYEKLSKLPCVVYKPNTPEGRSAKKAAIGASLIIKNARKLTLENEKTLDLSKKTAVLLQSTIKSNAPLVNEANRNLNSQHIPQDQVYPSEVVETYKEPYFSGEGYCYYGHWDKKKRKWKLVNFSIDNAPSNNALPKNGQTITLIRDGELHVRKGYPDRKLFGGYDFANSIGILRNNQKVKVLQVKPDIGDEKVWVKIESF